MSGGSEYSERPTKGTSSSRSSWRTRTKSKYDGTKSTACARRPPGRAGSPTARSSAGRSRSLKASKRASASSAGEVASKRTKSCLVPEGTAERQPTPCSGSAATRPEALQQLRIASARSSGASCAASSSVWRTRPLRPSSAYGRTRLKSVSRVSEGVALRRERTRATCAQFCIRKTSACSSSSTSMDESQSESARASPAPPTPRRSPSGDATTRSAL
mmetsp:Transcript_2814/g.9398  ORF Transcript_2814/g.9398 Transcript_2814/m.9398 type:complete len:217 (-) Transcript_2814:340-990(-)